MSYENAITAAGATVHRVRYFGDYQGTIWAKVTYEGVTGWLSISYGTCSGCDDYEAWSSAFNWDHPITDEALAEYGRGHLNGLMTQEAAEAEALKYAEWDSEAHEVLAFLREDLPAPTPEPPTGVNRRGRVWRLH